MSCPLCKMLNMIAELKKHPNETGFFILRNKAHAFFSERKEIANVCDNHRLPLRLTVDAHSVADYVNEVQDRAVAIVRGELRVRNFEDGKRRMMASREEP
jgi:hypothetical protein